MRQEAMGREAGKFKLKLESPEAQAVALTTYYFFIFTEVIKK